MTVSEDSRRKPHQFNVTDRLPYIEVNDNHQPVVLRQLDIQVKVTGLFAETTQIMQFYNPNKRVLEGNLIFPLPDTGVVCGYGLDVNGTLVDGVVVPKKKARQIFETEIRKGIDPGLLEQVQGNVYQTRIYPIPANGVRTVKIIYTSDLHVSGNGASYHLPLQHVETVDHVSLRVEVRQSPNKPVVSGGQGNISLTDWHQSWVAEATLQPNLITDDLHIRLPDLPNNLKMIETTGDGETFFCISQLVKATHELREWRPVRVAVAWDASGSRIGIDRDIELLQTLLARWQSCVIDVVVFRDKCDENVNTFAIENGNAQELIRYLNSLPYDGATDFSVLDLRSAPGEGTEAWFLFSDGMDTLEQQLPALGAITVIPVVSQSCRNGAFLEYLAEQSGGLVIDLNQLDVTDACNRVQYREPMPQLMSAEGCEGVYLQSQNGRFLVSGSLKDHSGKIQLKMPDGTIFDYSCDKNSGSDGQILARQYAGRTIQQLGVLGQGHGEEAMRLCRRFGIVSPGTSLLVFENIEQYLEYDIEPPDSLPEMREEFLDERREIKYRKEVEKSEHIESVVKLWNERVQWWKTDFQTEYKKKKKNKREEWDDDADYDLEVSSARSEAFSNADTCIFPQSMQIEHESLSFDDISASPDQNDSLPRYAPALPKRRSTQSSITVQAWSPDTPYLQAVKEANVDNQYGVYLQQRQDFAQSPSFFLDCGDYFLTLGEIEIGLRVLSNLLEMALEDVALMRIYAWRLQQAGKLDEAVRILEQVQEKRDDEPQSHRDLALALAQRWEQSGQIIDAIRAMELLYRVVEEEWDRFPEIEIIALMELNNLMHKAESQAIPIPERIDDRLHKLFDLDLRISMSWDADNTDVDLHVFEPDGSHAYYAHKRTDQGGLVSRDFRDGYGPEEYVLRKAVPGKYTIKAHYFGSNQQTLLGPCTVKVDVFINYGRDDEKRQTLILRLDESGSDFVVGEVVIEDDNHKVTPDVKGPQVEDFRKISLGMDMSQVAALVGTPHQVVQRGSDGVLVLEYQLVDGEVFHIEMKFKVIGVRQVINYKDAA